MAYTKTEWKDQNVENPRTYSVRDNGDSTVTLMDAFGTVTELGTPVNAENMNKIENGIANAVDKDSNQTITGTKVFNGGVPIKLNKAGNPYTEILYTSNGSTRLGGIRNIREGSCDIMQMYVASTDGSTNLGAIQLKRDDHNGILASAPHPAASTNYNNPAIMTVGRAADPSQNFNLLHRSGDETFSGVKTVENNNPRFGFKHTEIDVTTNPSAEKSTRIFVSDKNNKWISEIGCYQKTEGNILSQITANNDTAGVASLQIICKKDGSKYATCPTPPAADDNSTKISTTQWVNSRITSIMNSRSGVEQPNYATFQGLITSSSASNQSTTAPSKGWIFARMQLDNNTARTVSVNGKEIINVKSGAEYLNGNECGACFPVNSGDTISCVRATIYFCSNY